MTQRVRPVLLLVALAAAAAGGSAHAAPKPSITPKTVQEVISIQRTAKTGLAVLALIGKVQASKVPGFFATVDTGNYGAALGALVDFNTTSGLTRYGHGSASPLCDAPVVCQVDLSTDTLTFSITETDDADGGASHWAGVTRYLSVRGTHIDLQVAAVGFTVKRHTSATFARVTREQADADGVAVSSAGAEAFKAAQLPGGPRGSFAALQLPCDSEGAGAVTFSATGDTLPSVAECAPSIIADTVGVGVGSVSTYQGRPGRYSRVAARGTQWQVSGMVAGVSGSSTRLFVLSY